MMPRSYYEQLEACKQDIRDWLGEHEPGEDTDRFLYELVDNLAPQSGDEAVRFAIELGVAGEITASQMISGNLELHIQDVAARHVYDYYHELLGVEGQRYEAGFGPDEWDCRP